MIKFNKFLNTRYEITIQPISGDRFHLRALI